MSGKGPFRSGTSGAARSTAEEHLGDRLAAFVDGELRDDTRERVLAHLATCEQCKAEADEQRRLKNAVADAMPPALSAGLLARLQGLPANGPGGGDGPYFGGGLFGPQDEFGPAERPGARDEYRPFGHREGAERYLPPSGASALTPSSGRLDGFRFRIHDVNRAASRGRRFAFAAAGAFSLAAIALGGALPLDAAVEGGGAADAGGGSAVTPLGGGNGALLAGRERPGGLLRGSAAHARPLSVSAPMLLPQGGREPVSLASTTPEAVPQPPMPLTARSVAPSPLPLLGRGPAR
ncbi:anti-sigma factor family protein [Streptomyces silvisoli]|uniref:Zf-HC2 domain-containing protein n=1 Tax=Streptomyces silvisoli TaxID=3034235 RepID=A0ABT5ZQ58_9ACTN|nr:zf-HC2 domain-containing protein [Streptomyces silvisoli]MDF3291963.1 zf-HC2 domain-containing protein [Streptomyces silvisoli]